VIGGASLGPRSKDMPITKIRFPSFHPDQNPSPSHHNILWFQHVVHAAGCCGSRPSGHEMMVLATQKGNPPMNVHLSATTTEPGSEEFGPSKPRSPQLRPKIHDNDLTPKTDTTIVELMKYPG